MIISQTSTDARQYATINDAFADLPTGGRVVVPADMTVTSTVTVPDGKNLWCEGLATIIANHTGTAVLMSNNNNGVHRISTRRNPTIQWNTTDSTSIGLDLRQGFDNQIQIGAITGFWRGIRCAGVSTPNGVTHNSFYMGAVLDNMINIELGGIATAGFANENHFFSGRVRLSTSSPSLFAGTAGVLIGSGNGNLFAGTSFEGNRPERSLLVTHGSYNYWLGCRFEDASPIEFRQAVGRIVSFNTIESGYAILGENQDTLNPLEIIGVDPTNATERDAANRIVGPLGLTVYANNANGAHAAIEARSTSNPADAEIRVRNRNGDITFDLTHDHLLGDAILVARDSAGTLRSLRVAASGGLTFDGAAISGTTAQRPVLGATQRRTYFDDTLNAPVWWNGTVWVGAAGGAVTSQATVTITGDGATTSFPVAHNLALTTPFQPSAVTVLDPAGSLLSASSYQIGTLAANQFTVTFAVAPANGAVHRFRVTA